MNVFNGDKSSEVEYGLGYSMSTCSVAGPTAAPTISPTAHPSPHSTLRPSRLPTVAPTVQNSPLVTFTSNVTITGVTTPTLDDDTQDAVIAATAASMGISVSHVTYVEPVRGLVASSRGIHHGALRANLDSSSSESVATLSAPAASKKGVLAG